MTVYLSDCSNFKLLVKLQRKERIISPSSNLQYSAQIAGYFTLLHTILGWQTSQPYNVLDFIKEKQLQKFCDFALVPNFRINKLGLSCAKLNPA